MPGLDHIRSQSLVSGLSDVKCYFKWGTDYKDARQEVINSRAVRADAAGRAQPQLSPWNAIGEVFRYTVTGKGYTLRDLKTAQDWILERQFNGAGAERRHRRDQLRRREQGVPRRRRPVPDARPEREPLAKLVSALSNANLNVGGQRISIGEQSYNVRGVGLIKSLTDIGNVVVTAQKGDPHPRPRRGPALLIGFAPRLGIVGRIRLHGEGKRILARAQVGRADALARRAPRAARRPRRPDARVQLRRSARRGAGHLPHALRRRDAQDAGGHSISASTPHPA